jgi:hypothetical protein
VAAFFDTLAATRERLPLPVRPAANDDDTEALAA